MLIKENVEKMDTLVNGISEYSTIGSLQKEIQDININQLLEKIILKLDKKRVINFKIPKELPTIKANEFRIQLLFFHLIQNAIQFNNKRQIQIEINAKEESDFWQFSIKDNGKGIEKKYFDKIFKAFQKLENNHISSGIGLTIVKKIIDIYEGEISLESELNKGTVFYFTLKKQSWKHLI
jgi:light-regulated signal transduction histidine kinase (bacteriophytochrome)